ncbi:Programmed cell death protein 2 [Babesia sp. Xinjiang]|uniref:Programmed cell death protein 2 n=1 Tax=Babesia sp. Xinjiang TaxID=462227 RepID=UPI000A22EBFE|nr:Programmed cell death protein 2 [Babesia sp. Xinjiang]ORM39617.1 Programmed cell death protein 2 [Babesia sp. Xinjiang]
MDDVEPRIVELFAKVIPGESWQYQRQYFPSKIGGFPAWLDPENLPSECNLSCIICGGVMSFVLQLYAPDDDEPSGSAFHRSLYLFACQPCGTQWRVFRCQLPRKNRYYDFHPVPPGTIFPQPDPLVSKSCCPACCIPSSGDSEECQVLLSHSKVQDITDNAVWRALHPRCKIAVTHKTLEATFPESLLEICEGAIQEPDDYLSHERELYRKYQEKKAAGTVKDDDIDESEEQAIESIQRDRLAVDRSFERFCKRTTHNDVIYYCRDGQPIWTSDLTPRLQCVMQVRSSSTVSGVPLCELCGGPRAFEFQVLPQLLAHLKGTRLDFASVAVYTCADSCPLIDRYHEEFVYVEQDHSLSRN